jgi:hypothetical protein
MESKRPCPTPPLIQPRLGSLEQLRVLLKIRILILESGWLSLRNSIHVALSCSCGRQMWWRWAHGAANKCLGDAAVAQAAAAATCNAIAVAEQREVVPDLASDFNDA